MFSQDLDNIQPLSLKITKMPNTQALGNQQITYSFLSKKQKTVSILSNDRFLFLIGIESLNYANSLPSHAQLPFTTVMELPKPKVSKSIQSIQKISHNQEQLFIKFKQDSWEFICPSTECAAYWVTKINSTIQQFQNFLKSKYQSYHDYIKNKKKLIQDSKKQVFKQQNQPPKQNQIILPSQETQSPVSIAKQPSIQSLQKVQPTKIIQKEQMQEQKNLKNQKVQEQMILPQTKEENLQSNLQAASSRNSYRVPFFQQTPAAYSESNQNSTIQKISSKKNLEITRIQSITINQFPLKKNYSKNEQQSQIIEAVTHSKSAESESTLKKQIKFSYGPEKHIQDYSKTYKETLLHSQSNSFLQKSFNSQDIRRDLLHFDQVSSSKPVYSTYQLKQSEYIRIDNFLAIKNQRQSLLDRSVSDISVSGKENLRQKAWHNKRDWLEELVGGAQPSQLIINFKSYVQQMVKVIIDEINVPHKQKIYPPIEWQRQYASYQIDNLSIQVYKVNEKHLEQKHIHYAKALRTFKNCDYLLQVTQNESNLFVPLMTIFELKGFTGMAKTLVAPVNAPYKNKQFYQNLDKFDFQNKSKIKSDVFLDYNLCKIVSYQSKNISLNNLNQETQKIYFVDRLDSFLPFEKYQSNMKNLLRPQLVLDQQLEQCLFSVSEPMGGLKKVQSLLSKKVDLLVQTLQLHQEYFCNSFQLAQMLHQFGLNTRNLGILYTRIKQKWLKSILQAQIAAQCLKNFFRYDMQGCVLNQNPTAQQKQRQSIAQKQRAVSFLNLVLGSGDPSFNLWKGLNSYSLRHFGVILWEKQYRHLNIGYFLQALQTHLHIQFRESVFQRKLFWSNNALHQQDFAKFTTQITCYNLDFSQYFENINQCLQQVSKQNFQNLCQILTQESKSGSYYDLLKNHSIYSKISQYLLHFVSPTSHSQTYTSIQSTFTPHRYLYQNKLTEIKWLLSSQQSHMINHAAGFIQKHSQKWLGQCHPVMLELAHVLAEYYSDQTSNYSQALDYAMQAVDIQKRLSDGESEVLWKNYFLIGKIYSAQRQHQQALEYLLSSKRLVKALNLPSYEDFGQMCLLLARCLIQNNHYRQAYACVCDLYNFLKGNLTEYALKLVVESINLMNIIVEKNKQYEAFFRLIESQFINSLKFYLGNSDLFKQSIRLICFPYVKNALLKNNLSASKFSYLLQQLIKIQQPYPSCLSYLHFKTQTGDFPFKYIQSLKNIDQIMAQISDNNMLQRWMSYSHMSKESLLAKLQGTQSINRGFQILADFTAIFGLYGTVQVNKILSGQ